ncbi:tRNA methyltransferase [Nitrosopumilus oxyclinae]|uniref:tRNA methyltransferase n=1 Tax=Nitrosopumilus oxyclinae TaxID=1959104 RepID=A0A7D5M1M5_9ARCH|nr:tRNA (adenine-N1)-methyltransferase [Nitrosopumilus oxyclinae]QLH04826.1 tRNA methyltransferase [Nitrosopumilus oxyclinae]
MAKIKNNSPVLFFYNNSKKWLTKISKKESFHTHIGIIKHSDAIGKEYGSRLMTNKDKYVYLLQPTMYDYVMKIQHGTQIVYPKDIGYIIARAGIGDGQKILEIGTGSGSLTSFVASVVKPRGHVYTFDVDENFMKIAEKNIKKAGVSKYVTQHNLDLKTAKKMPLDEMDMAIIDLGDPWVVIPQVRQMLKGSGTMFAICPTMNQLEKLTMALVENEFTDIESTEHIIRNIEAREGKTRHSFQGIGHTTYLCFARKAFFGREARRSAEAAKVSDSSKKTAPKIVKKTITKPAKKTSGKTPKRTSKKSA